MTPNQQRVVDTVREYVGCSLLYRRDELAALICFPGDDPRQEVQIKTNCAMFTLGVWRVCGVQHPLLKGKYKSGMAVAWVLQIASDLDALRHAKPGDILPPGASLHYATKGKNNDHVEFCLSAPDARGNIQHAGGGRTNNAISAGVGFINWNYGRPLQHWVDPSMLLNNNRHDTDPTELAP
jgi:hypothetical protein